MFNMKEAIYSVCVTRFDSDRELVKGTVNATVINENVNPEISVIIKDRCDGVICVSDANAIESLIVVLEQVLKDARGGCMDVLKERWVRS